MCHLLSLPVLPLLLNLSMQLVACFSTPSSSIEAHPDTDKHDVCNIAYAADRILVMG